jgi:hypothetical protein
VALLVSEDEATLSAEGVELLAPVAPLARRGVAVEAVVAAVVCDGVDEALVAEVLAVLEAGEAAPPFPVEAPGVPLFGTITPFSNLNDILLGLPPCPGLGPIPVNMAESASANPG